MKLLYFLPLLSTKGGQERTLIDKANWLVEREHDVSFVTFENDGLVAYPLDWRIRHVDIDCRHFTIYRTRLWRRWGVVATIKRQFRERMSAIISDFQPDLIVAAIPLTEFFLCDLLQVAGSVPVVIESHLARGHEALARTFTEKALDVFYSPLRAIRRADLLIALTEEDANCWKRKQVENVRVIPNPLTFYPTTLAPVPRETGRIVCVGRLATQKRFDRLIDAFALVCGNYPEWHVDVFGDGEERQQLTDRIRSKGLQDRIHLNLPTSEIYTEYQRSEFFVLCSDYEGFGLVVTEAMSCGIPVVSTDCPFGPSEIIEDGKTGLLSKMDAKDLAEKMEWMIIHEEERKAMGIAARKAAARYRKEIVMPQWEQAYLSVIK